MKGSIRNIFDLFSYLSRKRKFQLIFVFFVMLLSGLCEGLSLASLLPVLNAISDPKSILGFQVIGDFLNFFNLTSNNEIVVSVVIIFTICFCMASAIRTLNIRLNTKFSALAGHDISVKVFKSIIFVPYEKQILFNSSEEINALITHVNNCIILFENFLQVFTSLVVACLLVTILILINWKVALSIVIIFTFAYSLISIFVKNSLIKNSKKIGDLEEDILQDIQESFGSIRDIILSTKFHFLLKKYSDLDRRLRLTKAENVFLGSFPRYVLESIGLLVMSLCLLIFTVNNISINLIFPILGAFALGTQKLLPTLQQTYYGWVTLKGFSNSSSIIIRKLKSINKLDQFTEPVSKSHILKKNIQLKNVSFKYHESSPLVLEDINLLIKKGEKIGILGKSGSGKTTLVDIIMGLLPPTSGKVFIDGINIYDSKNKSFLRAWRNSISHVPQSIFLLNNSIERNISFTSSNNQIDILSVISASKKAQLHDYVSSLPSKYKTIIGERGIRISGGQRQRIAIARALYKKSRILIFDEATSALDNLTEKKIVNSLDNISNQITSITIAHRINTLVNCDRKIEVLGGKLNEIK